MPLKVDRLITDSLSVNGVDVNKNTKHYELDLDVTNTVTVDTTFGIIDIINITAVTAPTSAFTSNVTFSINNPALDLTIIDNVYVQFSVYYNQTITDKVKELTKNSTIDELFGADIRDAKNAIANKDQFKPLTKDPIRLAYDATINRELIENSSTIISRSNYDLASVGFGDMAVQYLNLDPLLRVIYLITSGLI